MFFPQIKMSFLALHILQSLQLCILRYQFRNPLTLMCLIATLISTRKMLTSVSKALFKTFK